MNPLDDLSQINFVPKPLPEDTTPDVKLKKDRGDGMFVASCDEESFGSGFYDTREEAILSYPKEEDLQEGDRYFVAETVKFDPTVNADRVIENAYEEAAEAVGEVADGWLDGIKREEEDLLTDMLTDAFKRWLMETGNTPRFYECKNVTEHRAPPPPPPPQLDMFEKRKVLPGTIDLNLDLGPDDRFEL